MRYEHIKATRDGGWAVEAIDFENEGVITRVLFMGENDEYLAREYAEWKNASMRPQHQSQLRTSET